MNRRGAIVAVIVGACVCLLIAFAFHRRVSSIQVAGMTQTGPASPATGPVSFEQAQRLAIEAIEQRDRWPESPEAVCKAFWDARAAKDYAEMAILWPGSDSFDWPKICKSDADVEYVFGPAGEGGASVPYAAKDHFDAEGTFNLTMRLHVLQTPEGPRYYITGGN